MIKIVFNRKNKMLHSCFTTKTVLALLEQNYKTYCSLNNEVRSLSVYSIVGLTAVTDRPSCRDSFPRATSTSRPRSRQC